MDDEFAAALLLLPASTTHPLTDGRRRHPQAGRGVLLSQSLHEEVGDLPAFHRATAQQARVEQECGLGKAGMPEPQFAVSPAVTATNSTADRELTGHGVGSDQSIPTGDECGPPSGAWGGWERQLYRSRARSASHRGG